MDTKTFVNQIAKFHKNYGVEFLKERIENRDAYLKTPKSALFLILSYSFYQGRRNEISSQFEERARKALSLFLKNNNILSTSVSSRTTDKARLQKRYKDLDKELKNNEVNKEGDRLMVMSLVNLTQFSHQKNILAFLIGKIRSKAISKAYKNLDETWSIGPKIASLILRDIVCIYELEKSLNKDDYCFLQPIDTWVHRLSKKIGLINKDKIYKDEGKDITHQCLAFGVNPIHYNQGAWYIGARSLQILLRNIAVIK